VIFLGCIHQERDGDFNEICLRCAAVELHETDKKSPVMETLTKTNDWESIKEVHKDFRELEVTFPLRSFYETEKTVYRKKTLKTKSAVVSLLTLSKVSTRLIPHFTAVFGKTSKAYCWRFDGYPHSHQSSRDVFFPR